MAESCVAMILREFPESVIEVQFNFITGMISFVVAQAIRFYRELSARPFTGHVSRAAAWILGYVALQMIAFFNAQLIFADGYPQLAGKYFKFLVSGAVNGLVELRPAPVLALGCLAMGLYYVALALLDADQDGQFTVADIKLILRGATNYLTGRPTPPTQPVKRE